MLSLQIILTYKSRLKYGHQKNSWKVSINCKTPWWSLQSLQQSAGLMKNWKRVRILVTLWVGHWYVSGWQERLGNLGFQPRDLGAAESCCTIVSPTYLRGRQQPSIRSLPSINLGSSSDILCLLIRGRLGGIRLPLSGFCLRSEQATEPLTFLLAEASMLEKSWQFIHFAPSRSQLMSDWWDPPSLMLYSSESALLGKKFYPSKLKRNISASSC